MALSAAAAGVLLLILTPFLKKLMHEGVRTPEDDEHEASLHPKEYPAQEESGVTRPHKDDSPGY